MNKMNKMKYLKFKTIAWILSLVTLFFLPNWARANIIIYDTPNEKGSRMFTGFQLGHFLYDVRGQYLNLNSTTEKINVDRNTETRQTVYVLSHGNTTTCANYDSYGMADALHKLGLPYNSDIIFLGCSSGKKPNEFLSGTLFNLLRRGKEYGDYNLSAIGPKGATINSPGKEDAPFFIGVLKGPSKHPEEADDLLKEPFYAMMDFLVNKSKSMDFVQWSKYLYNCDPVYLYYRSLYKKSDQIDRLLLADDQLNYGWNQVFIDNVNTHSSNFSSPSDYTMTVKKSNEIIARNIIKNNGNDSEIGSNCEEDFLLWKGN